MYRPLIVLALGTFAIGTDSFVVAGILPEIADSLEVSRSAAGQLITAYALAYALFGPVMAAATARWPRRRVLLTGLAVFCAGNLATALLPAYGLVLASRVVAGLGGAMFTPIGTAVAAQIAPPDRRGRAISIVMAGLSAATALGAPIGTVLGSAGDWRVTMLFVTALGALAFAGVAVLLPPVPVPPPVPLRRRLAPLADARVTLSLGAVLGVFTGLYAVYSYISASFDRATDGDGATLAALLFVWGVAATAGNLGAGAITDRFGDRRVINVLAAVAALDFALLPWTSRTLLTAALALVVWGVCGWGLLVPSAHRLIGISPATAPLLTALNAATVYVGVSLSGVIGAAGIAVVGAHRLGLVGAVFILTGLVLAELAHRRIRREAPAPVPVS
ncbi:MFS transporter [Actinomadura roseirufa]|uniref:MFS transporter n=1 Tax=Actinomadura roseirufa TaxID=2094049 RepID=UPI0010411CF1|nr:MFS transporter [Actinomadura roseirufa]